MIINQVTIFLDNIFKEISFHNINIEKYEIDHLCYRTSCDENYIQTKSYFSKVGKCLTESQVNNRLIATYKLHKPILYKNWLIDLIEVPAPKPHQKTLEGFEHIEVVIDKPFEDILAAYPTCNFKQKGIKKKINPELAIKFAESTLKFHHKSLEHIINIEKNIRIMKFLNSSDILSHFSVYSPCISGTIPLDIQNDSSDLDILFQAKNLREFATKAEETFSLMEEFSIKSKPFQGLESVVIDFKYEGLPINLFCQNRDVLSQQANLHFLIEGRLIKLLGLNFKEKIISLKQKGVKTESAFGILLGLTKPHQDLLTLNQLSDIELIKKYSQDFK